MIPDPRSEKEALRRSVREVILTDLRQIADGDGLAPNEWSDHRRHFRGPWVNEIVREECERAEEILRAGWSPSGKHRGARKGEAVSDEALFVLLVFGVPVAAVVAVVGMIFMCEVSLNLTLALLEWARDRIHEAIRGRKP